MKHKTVATATGCFVSIERISKKNYLPDRGDIPLPDSKLMWMSETKDFIHYQFYDEMMLINKHNFQIKFIKGYWQNGGHLCEPNFFYSNKTRKILVIYTDMKVKIFDSPENIRRVVFEND